MADKKKKVLVPFSRWALNDSLRRPWGIDVSKYQGKVDWKKVVSSGVSFVFIKATEGATGVDPRFEAHSSGAYGLLPRGTFHLMRPFLERGKKLIPREVLDEINHYSDTVKKVGAFEGPPVLDFETRHLRSGLEAGGEEYLRQYVQQGILYTSNLFGRPPLIYISKRGLALVAGMPSIMDDAGGYWIADYVTSTAKSGPNVKPWSLWQVSSSGTVAGIKGAVDVNCFNGGTAELSKLLPLCP